jgi:hypothetical protein
VAAAEQVAAAASGDAWWNWPYQVEEEGEGSELSQAAVDQQAQELVADAVATALAGDILPLAADGLPSSSSSSSSSSSEVLVLDAQDGSDALFYTTHEQLKLQQQQQARGAARPQLPALPLPAAPAGRGPAQAAVAAALRTFFNSLQASPTAGSPSQSSALLDVSIAQREALEQYARSWLELAGSWKRDLAGSLHSYLAGQKELLGQVQQVYSDVMSQQEVGGF